MVGCSVRLAEGVSTETQLVPRRFEPLFGTANPKRGTYFSAPGNGSQLLIRLSTYLQGVILNYSIYVICSIARL
jgi:hypothetical protein